MIAETPDGTFIGCGRSVGRWWYLDSNIAPSGQGGTAVIVTVSRLAGRFGALKSVTTNAEFPPSTVYESFDLVNGDLIEIGGEGLVVELALSTRGTLALASIEIDGAGTPTESLTTPFMTQPLDSVQLGPYAVAKPIIESKDQ
ncbi:MAG: hypothetical protein ACYDHH_12300 [Solirubrobacteraceae bacterium]